MERNYRVTVMGKDQGTLPHSHFAKLANAELQNALLALPLDATHTVSLFGGDYTYRFVGVIASAAETTRLFRSMRRGR